MTSTIASSIPVEWTVADVITHLGGIPPERIRMWPPPGTATEPDIFEVERRTGRLCELVDGVLVEKTMGYFESRVAVIMAHLLEQYLDEHDPGIVLGADGMLRILPNQVRVPDISFIRWERFPGRNLPEEPIPAVAPDLAVEILSEGNTESEMRRKLHDYFQAGSRLVWYIDPRARTARAYSSPDRFVAVAPGESLDGADVLPGFSVALGDLFARAERRGPR